MHRILCFAFVLGGLSAFGQNCQIRDLDIGGSRSDSVAAGCRLRDVVSGSRDSSNGIPYRLTVASPGILTAEMQSSALDPFLALISLSGRLIEANDNISATNRDSRLQVSVEAGTYILFAGGRGNAAGPFTLSTSHGPRANCEIKELGFAEPAEGELNSGSCMYQDFVFYTDSRTPTAAYQFRIAEPSVLEASMKSAKFPPWFAIFDEEWSEVTYADSEGEDTAEVTVSLPPGVYTLLASISTGDSGGPFTLKADLSEPRKCEPQTIAFGETVSGELAGGGCRFLDYDIPSDDPSPLKLYELEVETRGIVLIEMASKLFSPWIGLVDHAGELVASNDGDEPDYIGSVATSLRPGVYYVLASTWDDDGAFQLRATFQKARPCEVSQIQPGDSVEGSLSDNSCRVADIIAPSTDAGYAYACSIRLGEPLLFTAELMSTRFDAVLYLFAGDSRFLAADDNGAGGTNSRLITYLSPGEYTLVASSNRQRVGAFSLRTAGAAPPACPAQDIEPGKSASGVLEPGDCRLRELVTGALSTANAKRYRIKLEAAGVLKLEASSRLAPPAVILTDAQGNLIRLSTAGLNAAARMSKNLSAGEYFILIAAAQGASFDLRSSFEKDRPANE
jgi:hypothetical protein